MTVQYATVTYGRHRYYRWRDVILGRMLLDSGERSAHFQVGMSLVADVKHNEYGHEFRVSIGWNQPRLTVKVRL